MGTGADQVRGPGEEPSGPDQFRRLLFAALGWDVKHAEVFKKDGDVLAEIRRLREAAGEEEEGSPALGMELMKAEEVNELPVARRDPEEPPAKMTSLWVITKAGVYESTYESEGVTKHVFVENASRHFILMLDEDLARKAHAILGEAIGRMDGAGG